MHNDSAYFDPRELRWKAFERQLETSDVITPTSALCWLYQKADARKVPVGIIGPRDANEQQALTAEDLGRNFGEIGIPLITGGKNGVMEYASKGCSESGGVVIGLIPEGDWSMANKYVDIPIATGIGKARNVLIAHSSLALIAIGGGYGTMSEIAFGLHFNKPVFVMEGAPHLDGVQAVATVQDVISKLAAFILKIS